MTKRPNMFLDEEAEEIIAKLNTPFIDGDYTWLYFLYKIQLIPGGWITTIELERNSESEPKHRFIGHGYPSESVKDAWNQIPKDWFEKGSKEGKEWYEGYKENFER